MGVFIWITNFFLLLSLKTNQLFCSLNDSNIISNSKSELSPKILNGQNVDDVPFLISLHTEDMWLGVASLISTDAAITSNICTYRIRTHVNGVNIDYIKLRETEMFGTIGNRMTGHKINICNIARHPQSKSPDFQHNLAVLFINTINTGFNLPAPARLPAHGTEINDHLYLYGWDIYSDDGTLKMLPMRLATEEEYMRYYHEEFLFNGAENQIYAVSDTGALNSGDGGSPIIAFLPNGPAIVAIFSMMDNCHFGKTRVPGVFTALNKYQDWISNYRLKGICFF